jgi:hypothetical protein
MDSDLLRYREVKFLDQKNFGSISLPGFWEWVCLLCNNITRHKNQGLFRSLNQLQYIPGLELWYRLNPKGCV